MATDPRPQPQDRSQGIPPELLAVLGIAVGAKLTSSVITEAFRRALALLRIRLVAVVTVLWRVRGKKSSPIADSQWVDQMTEVIDIFRGQASDLAAGYVDVLRRVETGEPLPPSVKTLAGRLDPVHVAKSLTFAGPGAVEAYVHGGESLDAADSKAESLVTGTVARLVTDAARETVEGTVAKDPMAFAWQRVTDGDPCAFCAMLAARGPVYRSKLNATFIDGVPGNPYHNHCGCIAEPVYRRGAEWTQQAKDFQKLWVESARGLHGKEARNAFRRAFDQMKRDAKALEAGAPTAPAPGG